MAATNMTARSKDITGMVVGGDGKYRPHDLTGSVGAAAGEYAVSRTVNFVDDTGTIPISRLVGGNPAQPEYTWYVDESDNSGALRPQTVSVNTSDQLFGTECLQVVVTGSEPGAGSLFLSQKTNIGEAVNDIQYTREQIASTVFDDPQVWPAFDTIDSARAWYRPPAELVQTSPLGNTNFHVGAYYRSIGESTLSEESEGLHLYYYYNIPYLGGNWCQINWDTHPSHKRGSSGSLEHYNYDQAKLVSINAANAGYGAMDLLTRVYFNEKQSHATYPTTSLIDGVELYQNPNSNHDFQHIYCLWAGVHATDNDLYVGWKRLKTEDDKTFDVKYAFTRFSENGGFTAHGTAAPNGQNIDPPHTAGYNGVEYKQRLGTGGGELDVTGQDAIYIAIQHQDEATLYAEIRIPLTATGFTGVLG